ncbi:MAG: transposase family protein [Ruminococcus sp.]|nr:transposase family protein [Ruminococcus sp.]
MMEYIEDKRQQSKVRYPIKEIVLIVFCCTLSNVDDWEDMDMQANHIQQAYNNLKSDLDEDKLLCVWFGFV